MCAPRSRFDTREGGRNKLLGDAFREDHLAEELDRRGDLSAVTIDKILSGNPQRAFSALQ